MGMEELVAKRNELLAAADAITDKAVEEKRGLSDEEKTSHAELLNEARGVRELMDVCAQRDAEAAEQLPQLRAVVEDAHVRTNDDDGATETRHAQPRRDEKRGIYGPNSEDSFFLDVVQARTLGDPDARHRLAQDRAYTAAEMQKRDLGNIANKGAEAVVPLYLQDRFEQARVAKAVVSGLTTQERLPEQGDSITIPIQTGNAAVASLTQADPLNSLQETNAAFDVATSNILEVGGTQDLSNYLVERGTLGLSVDRVVGNHLADLLAKDEDERVIAAAIAAAGVAVTNTTSTPHLKNDFKKIADAAQQIHSSYLEAPSAIVCHPRRFSFWASCLDDQDRPVMVPMPVAMNPLGSGDGGPVAQGFTGYMIHGLPVYVDANITTSNGSGTNEDLLLVADWSKQYTWLGPILVDIDRSVMFKNSGMTVRARRYFATMAAHQPDAFAKITGTGFVTPSFA